MGAIPADTVSSPAPPAIIPVRQFRNLPTLPAKSKGLKRKNLFGFFSDLDHGLAHLVTVEKSDEGIGRHFDSLRDRLFPDDAA